MTAKTTKTIDDLGYQVYLQYEQGRKGTKGLGDEYARDSRNVASQIQTDIFEPILHSDFQKLFDLVKRKGSWSLMLPPEEFNDQKKRLFTFQLAPKLGPEEYLEMQIERLEDYIDEQEKEKEDNKEKKQRLFSWQDEKSPKVVVKEAQCLIELLKSINMLNHIMIEINSERYRYSKG